MAKIFRKSSGHYCIATTQQEEALAEEQARAEGASVVQAALIDNSKTSFTETMITVRVPSHLKKYYVLILDAALVDEARTAIDGVGDLCPATRVLRKILAGTED